MTEPSFTLDRIGDEKPEDIIVIMLGYSGAGEGKTWFLGTGGDRVAIIDTGNTGLPTLKSKLFREKVGTKPLVLAIEENQFDSNGFIISTAYDKLCDAIDWLLATRSADFDILAINDTTYARRFMMNKGLELGAGAKTSFTRANAIQAKLQEAMD